MFCGADDSAAEQNAEAFTRNALLAPAVKLRLFFARALIGPGLDDLGRRRRRRGHRRTKGRAHHEDRAQEPPGKVF
jgi:hypothetical protein